MKVSSKESATIMACKGSAIHQEPSNIHTELLLDEVNKGSLKILILVVLSLRSQRLPYRFGHEQPLTVALWSRCATMARTFGVHCTCTSTCRV